MRQPELQTTAPLDPDPKWPQGYIDALRLAGAQEKNIPYCVSWVRRFFARYPTRPRRELGRGEIAGFLCEPARSPGVSNWMVQQARNAIETYYERFRGIPLTPRTDREGLPSSAPSTSSECGIDPVPRSSFPTITMAGYLKLHPNVNGFSR